MQFSAMTLSMFLPSNDDPDDDRRIGGLAVEQALWRAELGYDPWLTDHRFRGPGRSNSTQFAARLAPQLPPEWDGEIRRIGEASAQPFAEEAAPRFLS